MAAHGGFNKQLDSIEKKGMNSRWLKDPQVDSNLYNFLYIQFDFLCGISRTMGSTESMATEFNKVNVQGMQASTGGKAKSFFLSGYPSLSFTLELAKLVITLS